MADDAPDTPTLDTTPSDDSASTFHAGQLKPTSEPAPDLIENSGQIDRSSIAAELQQKPWLHTRLNQMVMGEVGPNASDEVRRIQMESAMNRALVRGHSLEQALWDTSQHGSAAYYPPQSFIRGGYDKDTYVGDLKAVLSGSNYGAKYMPEGHLVTGNASGLVARHQFARGTPGFSLQTGSGPESYFSEGPFRVPIKGGGAPLDPTAVAQMSPAAIASVRSDVSNFPRSSNIEDRRKPGVAQTVSDAVNDTYLAARRMVGLGPVRPRYATSGGPDERLVTAQDLRDRIGVIRERHQAEVDEFQQLKTQYESGREEWFDRREGYHDAMRRYLDDFDEWMAGSQHAAATGTVAKYRKANPQPQPPIDTAGPLPKFDYDLTQYRLYQKHNPD
jgi:hypothetical protein